MDFTSDIKKNFLDIIELKRMPLYLDLYIAIKDPRCARLIDSTIDRFSDIYDTLYVITEKYNRD